MARNNLTNQQLLTELKARLPNFTQDEFITLTGLLSKYYQEFFAAIQTISPQAHHWIQQKIQEHQQEKTDQAAERLSKSLATK